MIRTRSVWIGAALVAVVIFAAVSYLRAGPQEVGTVVLRTNDVQRTLVVAGRVRATSAAELGAGASGVVQTVNVDQGDRVERGSILVRLDDREARALVAEAEARVAQVEATTRDEVRRAELEMEQAGRDLERIRAVLEVGALTRQLAEQAEQRLADAESRLEALRAGSGSAGGSAAVTAARATLEAARARLASTEVVAPFAGTVLERRVEPGDAVQVGGMLLTLASDGPVEAEVFPAEENLPGLRLGAVGLVSADAYPDDTFGARVSMIAPSIDPAQGTVAVRLVLEDPPAYLRPGMTLSVNIEAGRADDASVLPAEAVRGLGTPDPWVAVVREGRVERRPVRLGLRGDGFVEVLAGIEADEPVVARADEVEPGMRVRPRPAA